MNSLPAALLTRLNSLLPAGRVLTDPADCLAYAYDNSRRITLPQAVVFALDAEEIRQTILLANEFGVPVTPRGRGTGTAGGSLPEQGGIALSLERMDRVIQVDPANRAIVVEPGVLNQTVQNSVKPHGFFWPPDPTSAPFCSVGGNLATGAGGPHAVKYGTTRDHVLGLKAVTGKGDIIRTGCYTTKGVVGYDLTRLLIGSEGTLAVITEATLKLTPLPEKTGGITAHYRDIESCARAIAAVMAQPHIPSALELLDAASLQLIRARQPGLLPDDTQAMLMIEIDGSAHELSETAAAILQALQNPGLISAQEAPDTARLWAARKALSPLLRDIAPKKINEDVVVPVSRLPDLMSGLQRLSSKHRVANANFGHAGNGNIHVNLLVNPDDPEEMQRAHACLDEIFSLVLELNGTLSGEHGVGSEKRAYVDREIDPVTLQLMRDIKKTFDPNLILNPGKLFPWRTED